MTDKPDDKVWDTATWEGSRRAQLRQSLRLSVRERLQALESLAETSRHFDKLRKSGAFHYGGAGRGPRAAQVGESTGSYAGEVREQRHVIHLHGCRPTPLAGYLKALATLRLVAEQKDPHARGWWEGEHFVLESTLDEAGLKHFFLEEYRPTPIVAPWNGGSGFYPKDNKQGMQALESSSQARFQPWRVAIEVSWRVLSEQNLAESPKDKVVKSELLTKLRARLPDEALAWMDAALVLTGDEVRFPPLLGTGGNDGRLDFTNNFMQRIGDVLDLAGDGGDERSLAWLGECLFGGAHPFMAANKAIGQFSPGQAGGPNAGTGYESESLINPWDFVLMIEGALLFAAAATRRLGSDGPGTLAFPFTVRTRGGGQGSLALTDEGASRAELWVPLWHRPAGLGSLRALFAEGRATLGRHGARDGLDFSRAVSALAVSRGIDGFQRYAFMMRSGKAFLATPLGRFHVPRSPRPDLVAELDHWLGPFQSWTRRKETAARVKSLAHRLDDTLFDMARQGAPRSGAVQRVLVALGEIQLHAGRSTAMREGMVPLPLLDERWFVAAHDNTREFRIAAALAGLGVGDRHLPPMRVHLSPIDASVPSPQWLPESAAHQYCTWHGGSLEKNLVAVLEKRLLLASRRDRADKPLGGGPPASLSAVGAFLAGVTDDRRISRLLPGLAHCSLPARWPARDADEAGEAPVVPAAYALLKLLFVPARQLRRCGVLAEGDALPVPPALLRLLAAGRARDALRLALRRLRVAGLTNLADVPSAAGVTGRRLAAALLIPLGDAAVRQLYLDINARLAEPRRALMNRENQGEPT